MEIFIIKAPTFLVDAQPMLAKITREVNFNIILKFKQTYENI